MSEYQQLMRWARVEEADENYNEAISLYYRAADVADTDDEWREAYDSAEYLEQMLASV